MGRVVTSAGKSHPRETLQVLAEEAPLTARGKRVPVAEINGQIIQAPNETVDKMRFGV
ncbi:hypothetical protein ABWK46_05115 [Peribacillus frigoritolerans]